jgi:O-antigen ligase
MDLKKTNKPSNALWIPLAWMFLAGSRYASAWLSLSVPSASTNDYTEGSPIDRAVFLSLILTGVFILRQRKIDWGRWLIENKWIVLYFLYTLFSIVWTDDPFVLFKRWIKDMGNPIMALVILTEQRPYEAIGVILRRLAFLFLPLSVLFVKYIPDLGRAYHIDGSPLSTGVGQDKNDLGQICLITGIYFFWKLLRNRKLDTKLKLNDNIADFILIAMLMWLLSMSNSQTSLSCLVVVAGILIISRIKCIDRKPSRIVTLGILSSGFFLVLESTFHLKDIILALLGRNLTLTNRTEIWALTKSLAENPFVGNGFMSFWSPERTEIIAKKLGAAVNQAHNGYLEQYLNLGYIGVTLIGVILLSGLMKVRKHLDLNYYCNGYPL